MPVQTDDGSLRVRVRNRLGESDVAVFHVENGQDRLGRQTVSLQARWARGQRAVLAVGSTSD